MENGLIFKEREMLKIITVAEVFISAWIAMEIELRKLQEIHEK